jgi:hypothetical protein
MTAEEGEHPSDVRRACHAERLGVPGAGNDEELLRLAGPLEELA